MRRTHMFLAVTVLTSSVLCLAGTAPRVSVTSSELAVGFGGNPACVYRYATVPFKPYVVRLFSPGGVQILRDSPHDHRHHHGLMYAITAGGVNFWEEQRAPGAQKHRALRALSVSESPEKGAAFTEELIWTDPRTGSAILLEERQLRVRRLGNPQATVLSWRSTFSLPPQKNQALLTGSHYHGLGMRFVQSMDQGGTFLNESGDLGPIYRGTERLGKSQWCLYRAKAGSRNVTVAMAGHPRNPRGAPVFFTMTKPFAYLSATLGLQKKPLVLEKGQVLSLSYGVFLWDGEVDRTTMEKTFRLWLQGEKDTKGQ